MMLVQGLIPVVHTDYNSRMNQRITKQTRATGGQVVLRRLTRYEYQNTMRDLVGLSLHYAKD